MAFKRHVATRSPEKFTDLVPHSPTSQLTTGRLKVSVPVRVTPTSQIVEALVAFWYR